MWALIIAIGAAILFFYHPLLSLAVIVGWIVFITILSES